MTDQNPPDAAINRTIDTCYELTDAERLALPAKFHQPVWDHLGEPHSWICAVCWGDGWATSWPCAVALTQGLEVARAGGLRYAY